MDERDLQVGLVKLGLAHERHYRECPGGPDCNFLNKTSNGPASGTEGTRFSATARSITPVHE